MIGNSTVYMYISKTKTADPNTHPGLARPLGDGPCPWVNMKMWITGSAGDFV